MLFQNKTPLNCTTTFHLCLFLIFSLPQICFGLSKNKEVVTNKKLLSFPISSNSLGKNLLSQNPSESLKFQSSNLPFLKFISYISRKKYKKDIINNYIYIGEVFPNYPDIVSFEDALESGEEIKYKIILIAIQYMNLKEDTGDENDLSKVNLLPIRVNFFSSKSLVIGREILFTKSDVSEELTYYSENDNSQSKKKSIRENLKSKQVITLSLEFKENGDETFISTKKTTNKNFWVGKDNCNKYNEVQKVFEYNPDVSLSETLETFSEGIFCFEGVNEKNGMQGENGKNRLKIPFSSELMKFFSLEKEFNKMFRNFRKSDSTLDPNESGNELEVCSSKSNSSKVLFFVVIIIVLVLSIGIGAVLIRKIRTSF